MAWRMGPRDGCRLFIRENPGFDRRLYEYDPQEDRVYRVRIKDGVRRRRTWHNLQYYVGSTLYREIIPLHLRVPEGL
mgnify:FL=1